MTETIHRFCQRIIYALIARPVALLVRIGMTPNHVTALSFAGNIAAAALIVCGHIGWGGAAILLSSSLDMVDGYMARTHRLASRFGAFLDSVLDRYSELVTLFALHTYIYERAGLYPSLTCSAALMGSLMVSYTRARAEGLGVDCRVGLMQRPERVVITSLGCVVAGLVADDLPLLVALAAVAVFSNVTAIVRIAHVYRHAPLTDQS